MRAILLTNKNKLEIQEIEEPSIKSPDEVIIETDALSICGTDAEVIDGTLPTNKLPIVIGHEGSGKVIRIGEKVNNVQVGDRVLIDPNRCDLTCSQCVRGLTHLCPNGGLMGRETDGVFAEQLVLPSRNIYRLPDSISVELSPLIQPLSTVVHAHERVRISPGDTILVLGLGVTGLMLAQLAKKRGAYVIASSTISRKVELAKQLKIDAVLNRSEEGLASGVMRITNNEGVDLAIDATSYQDLLTKKVLSVVKPGGTVLLFATKLKQLNFDPIEAYFRELTFKTTRSSRPRDFVRAIRLVAQNDINLSYQITKSFPFEKTKDAVSFFQDRENVLKTIIRPNMEKR